MMMENLMPEFGNKTFDGGIVSPISRYHDITISRCWLLAAGCWPATFFIVGTARGAGKDPYCP
jgi:hypothetical protein